MKMTQCDLSVYDFKFSGFCVMMMANSDEEESKMLPAIPKAHELYPSIPQMLLLHCGQEVTMSNNNKSAICAFRD